MFPGQQTLDWVGHPRSSAAGWALSPGGTGKQSGGVWEARPGSRQNRGHGVAGRLSCLSHSPCVGRRVGLEAGRGPGMAWGHPAPPSCLGSGLPSELGRPRPLPSGLGGGAPRTVTNMLIHGFGLHLCRLGAPTQIPGLPCESPFFPPKLGKIPPYILLLDLTPNA